MKRKKGVLSNLGNNRFEASDLGQLHLRSSKSTAHVIEQIDATGAAGLFKFQVEGGSLNIITNTSEDRDFSTYVTALKIDSVGNLIGTFPTLTGTVISDTTITTNDILLGTSEEEVTPLSAPTELSSLGFDGNDVVYLSPSKYFQLGSECLASNSSEWSISTSGGATSSFESGEAPSYPNNLKLTIPSASGFKTLSSRHNLFMIKSESTFGVTVLEALIKLPDMSTAGVNVFKEIGLRDAGSRLVNLVHQEPTSNWVLHIRNNSTIVTASTGIDYSPGWTKFKFIIDWDNSDVTVNINEDSFTKNDETIDTAETEAAFRLDAFSASGTPAYDLDFKINYYKMVHKFTGER